MSTLPFEKIVDAVSNIIDFPLKDYEPKFIKRRFDVRMRVLNKNSLDEYLLYLRHNPDEVPLLKNEFLINVTHFFRDKTLWDYLNTNVLHEISVKKNALMDNSINIFCAGCSSGDEVYTIAILFSELIEKYNFNLKIKIHGVDLDENIITKAKEGIYSKLTFKETNSELIKKYFKEENDFYVVKDKLKGMCSFGVLDLLTDKIPQYVDLIFCRNTVIYFDTQAKDKLYEKFHDSLVKDGYLVIGKTETIMGDIRSNFNIISSSEKIYQKK